MILSDAINQSELDPSAWGKIVSDDPTPEEMYANLLMMKNVSVIEQINLFLLSSGYTKREIAEYQGVNRMVVSRQLKKTADKVRTWLEG